MTLENELYLYFPPESTHLSFQHDKEYGTSRPVEHRKLIDHYIQFLKGTTNFYRTFIQRLVSHFNIVELHPIVKQFNLEGTILSPLL